VCLKFHSIHFEVKSAYIVLKICACINVLIAVVNEQYKIL
jgi:hypothetical protein